MTAKRLLIIVNDANFFLSHRLPVALAAQRAGFEVHIATSGDGDVEQIVNHGFGHTAIELSRSGSNPLKEIKSIFSIFRVIRKINPDVLHLVTIKPVLYGGIVARLIGVKGVVLAISGLGSVFSATTVKLTIIRGIVKLIYRYVLAHKNIKVIFQNPDDLAVLDNLKVLGPASGKLIRGSGVDLDVYRMTPEQSDVPIVVLAARLLREKGVFEFVQAARIVKSRGISVRFQLIGTPDPGNPSTITDSQLESWKIEGIVEVLGYRRDVPDLLSGANIVTLPSYYGEGVPKVLLEAAACGRAVVTTDHPGCRYAIEPDITGILVPIREPEALADAIQYLLSDSEKRVSMGQAGRRLAEQEFAIDKVINAHLDIYDNLITNVNQHI